MWETHINWLPPGGREPATTQVCALNHNQPRTLGSWADDLTIELTSQDRGRLLREFGSWMLSFCLFSILTQRICFYLERKEEREEHQCFETSVSCFPSAPPLGMEPETFWCMGWWMLQAAEPLGQALHAFFLITGCILQVTHTRYALSTYCLRISRYPPGENQLPNMDLSYLIENQWSKKKKCLLMLISTLSLFLTHYLRTISLGKIKGCVLLNENMIISPAGVNTAPGSFRGRSMREDKNLEICLP